MFGLGFWEIAIVLAVVLVVLGPKNLPSFAKSMGKALREFRSATNDLRRAVESETVDDGPYRDQPSPAPGDDDDEDKPPEGDEPPDDYGSTPALPETTEEAEEAEEPRTKTPDAALVTAKLGDEKVKEAMRSRLRLARKSGSRASATLGKLELRRSKTPEPADAGVKDVKDVEERLATQPVSAGQVEAVIAVADERLDVDDGQIEEEMERPTPVPDGPPRAEAEASPASDQEEPEEAKPAAKGKKPAAKGKKKPAAKKKPTAKKKPAAKKKPEEAKADSTSKAEPKTKAKAEPKSKSKATAKKAAAAASSDDKAKAAPKKKAKPKAKAKAKADPKAKKPAKKAAKKSTKKSSKKDGGES